MADPTALGFLIGTLVACFLSFLLFRSGVKKFPRFLGSIAINAGTGVLAAVIVLSMLDFECIFGNCSSNGTAPAYLFVIGAISLVFGIVDWVKAVRRSKTK